jgi:hypothetical protein
VTGAPPLLLGAVNDTEACPFVVVLAVTDTLVGAPGTVGVVTLAPALGLELPSSFVAVTVTV